MKRYIELITNTKYWLIVGSIGVWILVLQNFGVFGSKSQRVYVTGGDIDADVHGCVSVDNTVDVNLDKVLGYPVGCHRSYTINGKEYQAIDVFQSNRLPNPPTPIIW